MENIGKGYYKTDVDIYDIFEADCSCCKHGHYHGSFNWRWCEHKPQGVEYKRERNKDGYCKNFERVSKIEKILLRCFYLNPFY